jgi:hypothetical protein
MLKAKHPEETMAPTGAIDEMWHLHMLHPRAYHDDCIAILGRILDHNPGAGKLPGTLPQLLAHFQSTARLWAAEFGTDYRGSSTCGNDVVMCEENEKKLRTLDDVVMCEENEKKLRTLDDVVMCEENEKRLCIPNNAVMIDAGKDLSKWPGEQA